MIKINKLTIIIAFILLVTGCSTDDISSNGTVDAEVSENRTVFQSEDLTENVVQEEDDGTYYTMEEVEALGIPEDMLAYWMVLNGKMPFVSYDEGSQEFYWDEYFWFLGNVNHYLGIPEKNIYWGDPTSFTIVDMNNDGKNEIAIALDFGAVQILHYEDGAVYGYQFVFRGMCPIYLNGIYEGSSAANHSVYRRFTELNKDGYTEEILAEAYFSYDDDSYSSYEMGGVSVSREEFEEFRQTAEGVGEVEDIDYTEELLDEYLLAGLSEDELYMVKHAAAEPITDTAEYSMEPEIMQAYYEVLTGEKEFISVMDDNRLFYVDGYQDRNEDDRGQDEILYFSIVDMDRDGVYEVILFDDEANILHYKDGNIYCYRCGEIGAVANSGIFSMGNLYYFGHGDDKYGIINSFDENGCDIEEIDYNGNINDDRIRYYYFSEQLIEQYFR